LDFKVRRNSEIHVSDAFQFCASQKWALIMHFCCQRVHAVRFGRRLTEVRENASEWVIGEGRGKERSQYLNEAGKQLKT